MYINIISYYPYIIHISSIYYPIYYDKLKPSPHLACGIIRWVHTAGVGPMTLRCSQQMLRLLSKAKMDQEINQALVANPGDGRIVGGLATFNIFN